MPTPAKKTVVTGSKTPARKTPAARKPLPRTTAGEYTHFSDKITGALENISNVIEDNKGTLDSIQDMSLQLTRTVMSLRTVVMKYVDKMDDLLETAVPIMEKLPIFPERLTELVKDALELTQKLNAVSELVQKVLPGVESSLITADVAGLQKSSGHVAELTKVLQDIAPDKDDKK